MPTKRPSRAKNKATSEEVMLAQPPGLPVPSDSVPSQDEHADDRPAESVSMASEPSDHDIRMRAYQRYLERGGQDGGDFDDWLVAERELRAKIYG